MRCVGVERRWHHQSVRLHALIDLGNVAANHQPGGRRPGRLSGGQLLGALLAMRQQQFRFGDLVDVEELVVLQGVAQRLLIDEDVGQQRIALQFLGRRAQAIESRLQFRLVGRRNFDADRWDRLGRRPRCRRRLRKRHPGGEEETTESFQWMLLKLVYHRRPRAGWFLDGGFHRGPYR